MKALIQLSAIFSVLLITSACNNVKFDDDTASGTSHSQGGPTPPPLCQPTGSSTTTYTWYTTAWSACSVTCGTGTQTRTATCQANNSCSVVSNSLCSGSTEPGLTQACVQTACNTNGGGTPETQTATVPKPMVDLVLILDTSMTNANTISNLSGNLINFFATIENKNIDWQACVITTDVTLADAPTGQDGAVLPYAGEPLEWAGSFSSGNYYPIQTMNPNIINSQTPNLSTVLSETANYIQSISPGQGNAQGIGALYWMVKNYSGTSGCFRSGATVATILMSDKDENSTYGNCNRTPDGLAARGLTADPLENFCEPAAPYEDPATANSFVTSTLGTSLVYNSIIVEPADSTCLNTETLPEPNFNTSTQTFWSPAFYGNEYVSMSNLTNGSIASICQPNNYTQVLSNISTKIVQALQDITLNCTPLAGTAPSFTGLPTGTTTSVNGNVVSFTPALPTGTTVTVNYTCQ